MLTEEPNSPFVFRSMTVDDEAYVYDTWLSDLWLSDNTFLPNDLWYPAHREVIRRVLEHPLVQIVVLADRVDETIIYGYAVRDPEYLHWIHVRRGKWRKRGLAKKLLQRLRAESLPLVWRTKLGHERLNNAARTSLARHEWWSTAARQAGSASSSG
jgi:hypothetical protein